MIVPTSPLTPPPFPTVYAATWWNMEVRKPLFTTLLHMVLRLFTESAVSLTNSEYSYF
jgi:hypothetical protein